MTCRDREYTGTVAEYPRGSYLRHIAHFRLMDGVKRAVKRNRRCGLKTVSITFDDEEGRTHKKRPVSWLVARIRSK